MDKKTRERDLPYQTYLIGYRDESRIKNAVVQISKGGFHAKARVIRWQPATPKNLSIRLSLFSRIQMLRSVLARKSGAVRASKLILGLFRHRISPKRDFLERPIRFAELALTEKHLRILSGFVESKKDIVVVFEDDVIALDEEGLAAIEAIWSTFNAESSWFLNLTDSFSPSALGISSDPLKKGLPFEVMRPPAANTTAAYAMNRRCAENILLGTLLEPRLRELPADWMFTVSFERFPMTCLRMTHPSFQNGSLAKAVSSTIRP